MTKQEIHDDVKQTLGFVPDWLAYLPDAVLEHEWTIMKNFHLGETTLPNKYKERIGLGVAASLAVPLLRSFPHRGGEVLWRHRRRGKRMSGDG